MVVDFREVRGERKIPDFDGEASRMDMFGTEVLSKTPPPDISWYTWMVRL